MKNSVIKSCIGSFFMILLLAFASAAVSFDKNSYSLDKASNSYIFTITSNNISDSDITNISINDSRFTLNDSTLTKNTSKQIKITYDYKKNFSLEDFESASFELTAKNESGDVVASALVKFEGTYCGLGGRESRIVIRNLEDEELDNSKEWEWRPLDNIEISFTIQNKGSRDEDISGVVEYCLFDETNKKCVIEDDFDFDVDGRDSEDFTIKFKVDPSKFDRSAEDYRFYIKAYDDGDYGGEDSECSEKSESVKVKIYQNEVIIDEEAISFPLPVNAGEIVTVRVPVYNVGSKDQKEVSVKMYSNTFNLDSQTVEVGTLKSGKSKKISFTFTLPTNLVEGKSYEVLFDVYDKDDDLYEYRDRDGKRVSAIFSKVFKVDSGVTADSSTSESSRAGGNGSVSISAELVGDANSGEKINIVAKITNVGNSIGTFFVSAIGYSSWADAVSSDQNILLLKAGESQDVIFVFDSKKEAKGENKFNIEVISNNQVIASQAVALEVESKSSWFNDTFGDNWYLWLIATFNLFLILAIIFVLIKLFFG